MHKMILSFLLLSLSQWALAQGLIFSSVDEIPESLTLERLSSWDGTSVIKHVVDEPFTMVTVLFENEVLKEAQDKLFKNNRRIFCEGEYKFSYDDHNSQRITVTALKVCLDEQGTVVAEDLGTTVHPEDKESIKGSLRLRAAPKNISTPIFEECSGFTKKVSPGCER